MHQNPGYSLEQPCVPCLILTPVLRLLNSTATCAATPAAATSAAAAPSNRSAAVPCSSHVRQHGDAEGPAAPLGGVEEHAHLHHPLQRHEAGLRPQVPVPRIDAAHQDFQPEAHR